MFQNYAADRERLTFSKLLELKKKLGLPVIYWDSIFKEMIRISATELVRKGTVVFDVAADMLARNHSWSNEKSALQLLKVMNFQQSAKNSNISAIIKAAQQKRLNID